MSYLMTTTNGATVDLHTKEGAYKYVAEFLVSHGADGTTMSALGQLKPSKKCGYCGHNHSDANCPYANEPRHADYIADKTTEKGGGK